VCESGAIYTVWGKGVVTHYAPLVVTALAAGLSPLPVTPSSGGEPGHQRLASDLAGHPGFGSGRRRDFARVGPPAGLRKVPHPAIRQQVTVALVLARW
jgi:hypothetical protein